MVVEGPEPGTIRKAGLRLDLMANDSRCEIGYRWPPDSRGRGTDPLWESLAAPPNTKSRKLQTAQLSKLSKTLGCSTLSANLITFHCYSVISLNHYGSARNSPSHLSLHPIWAARVNLLSRCDVHSLTFAFSVSARAFTNWIPMPDYESSSHSPFVDISCYLICRLPLRHVGSFVERWSFLPAFSELHSRRETSDLHAFPIETMTTQLPKKRRIRANTVLTCASLLRKRKSGRSGQHGELKVTQNATQDSSHHNIERSQKPR